MFEPHPSGYTSSRPNSKVVRIVRVLQLQTRVDQRSVFQRRWMEPGFMLERSGDVGIRGVALSSDRHLQNGISGVLSFQGIPSKRLQDLRAVDGTQGEARRRCSVDV